MSTLQKPRILIDHHLDGQNPEVVYQEILEGLVRSPAEICPKYF